MGPLLPSSAVRCIDRPPPVTITSNCSLSGAAGGRGRGHLPLPEVLLGWLPGCSAPSFWLTCQYATQQSPLLGLWVPLGAPSGPTVCGAKPALETRRRWLFTSLFLLEKQNANRSSEKPFLVLRFWGHVLEHTGRTEGCTDGESGINQASPPLCPRPSAQPQLGLWPHWAPPSLKPIEMKHEPV